MNRDGNTENITDNIKNPLLAGDAKAFLNASIEAKSDVVPQFLYNDFAQGQKVGLSLIEELGKCESFDFSVAFITQSGLQLLKPVLKELERRNIPGRILTTDYLCFTEPKALQELDAFSNITLKVFLSDDFAGFHTKGYFFFKQDQLSLIVGSSNLSASALCTNEEWNARLIARRQGEFARSALERFESLFHGEQAVLYSQIKDEYEKKYELVRRQKRFHVNEDRELVLRRPITPNAMQIRLIDHLHTLINKGESRALLISATATGKTYAAALAVQEFSPKRVLFLVHREQIAKKAMESFERILGDRYSYGLLSGSHKDYDASCLFCTVQTLSKPAVYERFNPVHFDWIIIDEVHRAAAESYRRIFHWFHPHFWFGMSATPVRGDGQSIYELFDFNVACQIGLRQALEEDLLCPFHYYAIDDLSINDEDHENLADFSRLTSDERVHHILEQANYYGHYGKRLKGLIFVSRNEEARLLSQKLNEKGLRTLALSGENSMEERERAIERLVQEEDNEQALDYLITVDIFNEGIDIPEVNQVLLLRPTQSAIVFVQQLGRGLRKAKDKDYVVILDFIGIYQNNFMIPQALSENKTGSKDVLRRFVQEGNRTLPGSSTVYFSELAKKRIFKSIEAATMNSAAVLMDGWLSLYETLGRVPKLVDFDAYEAMDPLLIVSNASYGSYQDFLEKKVQKAMAKKNVKIDLPKLSAQEQDFLRFISQQWANGKRPLELWLLQALIKDGKHWKEEFEKKVSEHGLTLSQRTWTNLENQFRSLWLQGAIGEKWRKAGMIFLEEELEDGKKILHISRAFAKALENPDFKEALEDLIQFGLNRWMRDYAHFEKGTWLNRNAAYTYADTFRLLDFEKAMVAQNVGGYYLDRKTNTMPVYINYDKAADIADSIAYEDHFENPQSLIAFSKANRTLNSPEIQALKQDQELFLPLFVRKNTKEDRKEFYYLGGMKPDGRLIPEMMKNGKQKVVKIGYRLQTPVRSDLYDYLANT